MSTSAAATIAKRILPLFDRVLVQVGYKGIATFKQKLG